MRVTESWRANRNWAKYLGKEGKIVSTTMMEAAATNQLAFLPYAYLVVDLGEEKISLIGGAGETFAIGDLVKLVLRKLKKEAQGEVIVYGLKVTHV